MRLALISRSMRNAIARTALTETGPSVMASFYSQRNNDILLKSSKIKK